MKWRKNANYLTNTLCFVVIIVLPVLYFGLAQYKFNSSYSIFDEITHISYAWSISHGELPAQGDSDSAVILNDWSCSGQENVPLPACNSGAAPEDYPNQGQQYNYFHPPLYYAITGFIARVCNTVMPVLTFSQYARLLSIVWMVLGNIALFFALKQWRVDIVYRLSVIAIVPFIPVLLNSGTAVTNDAPALICGAAVLWVAANFFVDRKPFYLPAIVTIAVCGSIKGTMVFPFLAMAAMLVLLGIITYWKGDRNQGRQFFIQGWITGITALLAVAFFAFIQSMRGDSSVKSAVSGQNTDPPVGSPIGEFLKTVMSWLNLADGGDNLRQGMENSAGYSIWLAILGIIIGAAAVMLYVQNDGNSSHSYLWGLTLFGLFLYPTLIQIRQYLNSGELFYDVSGRYGLAFLPLVLCCWALVLQNRKDKVLAVTIPVIAAALSFICILSIPRFVLVG